MVGTDTSNANTVGRSREIRIALVLYGGVSLAVYENGVTRAFFDLVKGRGVFQALLRLLDADAVVDVIAGASAGGINGLLLAAALESGSEFAATAELWRKAGDFGALLRPLSQAENAASLLDGEGYYHDHLVAAFRDIVRRKPQSPDTSPGEMDVFITGTHLEGNITATWDSLGGKITDKTHRSVFRLQHRPGRKALGFGHFSAERPLDLDLQAAILGSIARITSTFPGAFPPFTLEQLPRDQRQQVKEALEQLSGTQPAHHIYVDGGVLDNKPFGLVLNAIFFRMPTRLVDRRLFYVEPDPEHLSPADDEESARLQNPLRVALASISTIPAHESIAEDLAELKEHNARIRWLKDLKENYLERRRQDPATVGPDAAGFDVYRRVRIDHAAKLLVANTDDVPSAKTEIPDPDRKALYEAVRESLAELTEPKPAGPEMESAQARLLSSQERLSRILDPKDAPFHIRRAFHVLYRLYGIYQDATKSQRPLLLDAILAVGRIIKFLDLIQNRLFLLRDALLEPKPGVPLPDMHALTTAFQDLLRADAPPWRPIVAELQALTDERQAVTALAHRDGGVLATEKLTRAVNNAWSWIERRRKSPKVVRSGPDRIALSAEPTVLTVLENALRKVLQAVPDGPEILDEFIDLDRAFFPLEFAARIHELDEIEFARISPRDAQSGLCALPAAAKVTGDELAHFAAFFRRDWRSNDILWGRLDGICQIVRSLLDDRSQQRLRQRLRDLEDFLTPEYLETLFPKCPAALRKDLRSAWERLLASAARLDKADRDEKAHRSDEPAVEAWQEAFSGFRERLILAAHHQTVAEDLKGVYQDLFYQDLTWGTIRDEAGVGPEAGAVSIETRAAIRAQEAMATVTDWGDSFRQLGLGSQTVAGKKSAVPIDVLAQYLAQAYVLAWGMIQNALGGRRRRVRFLGERKTRWLFRTPVIFLHQLIATRRHRSGSLPLVYAAGVAALLACGITGLFFCNVWFVIPIAAAFLLMALVVLLKPKPTS